MKSANKGDPKEKDRGLNPDPLRSLISPLQVTRLLSQSPLWLSRSFPTLFAIVLHLGLSHFDQLALRPAGARRKTECGGSPCRSASS